MRASFIHVADTHLGYEQYGIRERFNDFSRAFWHIMREALQHRVDFVLIAGDLFNKRAIDALTLIHAINGLQELKQAGIPVIAIEGNHDRSYYREGASWLQFLCYEQYITLLTPVMMNGRPQIEPWQAHTMLGSHIDLKGGALRIYGLPWQGANIERSIEGTVQALQEVRASEEAQGVQYRILMMHSGLDGEVPRIQGLPSRGKFQELYNYVDYLALGHVHKPYTVDNWIYNPGSPETCSADEIQWPHRGYYHVEIDTEQPIVTPSTQKPCYHQAELIANPRRPFVRYELRVESCRDPQELQQRLNDYCRREGPHYQTTTTEMRPLVQVILRGTLNFDPAELDLNLMEESVRQSFNPLHVRIDNHTNDREYAADEGEPDGRDRSHWQELELRIFEELVSGDVRYLPAKEQWGRVISELKQLALNKDDPQQIAQYLRSKRATLIAPPHP